ncbi:hypothetical protein BDY19DRAFT_244656 [Irpex rosettiformis]|uniref:Uncharacterized protein n=1 Tax=Irpex rosettiformis TaxID=378272 RepID=A0ACB8TZ92_9APHY|nr:hypothetical protein BDY19DRAFT_244656 [Irpex rosettiformis]
MIRVTELITRMPNVNMDSAFSKIPLYKGLAGYGDHTVCNFSFSLSQEYFSGFTMLETSNGLADLVLVGPQRALIAKDVLGPLYIAIVTFAMLYGVSTVQAVLYYQHCQKDSTFFKCIILGLWFLDTSLFGVLIYAGWYTFVTDSGAFPALLNTMSWILGLWYTMAGICDLVISCVMIWMAWSLAGKKTWLLILMVVPVAISLAGFIDMSSLSFRNPLSVPAKHNAWAWQLPFVCHAFVDMVVCVTITTQLIKMYTGFKNSDFIIRLLIVWSVNSGLLASALSVASIITSFSCDTVASVLSKVMFNSLLGLLNTREYRKRIISGRAGELRVSLAPTAPASVSIGPLPILRTSTVASIWSQSSACHSEMNFEVPVITEDRPKEYSLV